jgi:Predicted membrane protein/domain
MFIIIGGDGKEYGPASTEQIRSWLAGGRANLETRAKLAGSDDWRTLADFPEFNPDGAITPPLIPTAVAPVSTAHLDPVVAADLAPRGLRLVARIIDWIIEFLCCLPGMLVLGPEFVEVFKNAMSGIEPDPEQFDMMRLGLGLLVTFAGWLILLIIQVLLLSTRGQSIGKMIAKVRVVRLDGTKAGFVYAWLLREALITFCGLILSLVPYIGVFFRAVFHLTDWCLIFRDDRRCLHDVIAGTQVIKA